MIYSRKNEKNAIETKTSSGTSKITTTTKRTSGYFVSTSCVLTTLFLVYVAYSMSTMILVLYPNRSVLDLIVEPEPYKGPALKPSWSMSEPVEVYVYLSLKQGVKRKRSRRRPRSRIADTTNPISLFNTTSRFDDTLSSSRCFELVSEETSSFSSLEKSLCLPSSSLG